MRRWLAGTFACAALGAAAVAACNAPRYDTHCTPDEADYQSREDCRYGGEGKGPQIDEPACPPLTGDAPTDPEVCRKSFDLVYGALIDPERGNCAATSCHGALVAPAVGVFLPVADPLVMHASLLSTNGSVGRPYVNAADARNSWMHCNIRGTLGGGVPMPPPGGLLDNVGDPTGDVEIVEDWLRCGAPPPSQELIDSLGSGGGGGAGGAGVGGAGGAGGASGTGGAGGA